MTTNSTLNRVELHSEPLPKPAVKLARRVAELASNGNGQYTVSLIFADGVWWFIVDGGKMERLGDQV